MRRVLAAVGALALGATGFAQMDNAAIAQSATGFGFKIGAFVPADSAIRDNTNNTLLDFGVEYDLEEGFFKSGVTFFGLDWISQTIFGADHIAMFHLDQRFYMGPRKFSAGGSAYFFLGVGIVGVDIAGDSGTGWGVRGGIGTEMRDNWFLEVNGLVTSEINGVNASGIGAMLGYRFK